MKASLVFLVALVAGLAAAKEFVLQDLLKKLEERDDLALRELSGSELEKRGSSGRMSSSQKDEILAAHNDARRSVSPSASNMVEMEWDTELETVAQNYAKKCIWGHNSQRSSESASYSYVGENLYLTTGSINPTRAVSNWVGENKYYTYSTGSCSSVCGHYTQVVWASSTKLGCASQKCSSVQGLSGWSDVTILVCNYGPGGNYRGRQPYASGSQCSACPSGTSCSNGLCSSGNGSGSSSGSSSSGSSSSSGNSSGGSSSGSGCGK